MKRIIISVLACTLFNGCGAVVWGSGYVAPEDADSSAETADGSTAADDSTAVSDDSAESGSTVASNDSTAAEGSTAADGSTALEGAVIDPAGGYWKFTVEQVASGDYATRSMKYVNANEQEITPRNSQGAVVDIFATSGFVNGLALVAQCIGIGSDGFCSDVNYGLMRQDGTFEMQMQANYAMPSFKLVHTYPAIIHKNDPLGNGSMFPMWSGVVEVNGVIGKANTLFSDDRILVVSRTDSHLGYVNSRGMLMLNTQYYAASDFSDGKATVYDPNRGYGVIDTAGIYTTTSYTCVSKHEENAKYLRVNKGGECLNPNADVRFQEFASKLYFAPVFFSRSISSSGDINLNCVGGSTGIVLKSDISKVVVPVEYDVSDILYVPEIDAFFVYSGADVTVYASDGTVLLANQAFVSISTICGYDLYLVKYRNGLMGAIKADGTEFLPPIYEELAFDKNAKQLAALMNNEIKMFDISSIAQKTGNNTSCSGGKTVSANMSSKLQKLKTAKSNAEKAKADFDVKALEQQKAEARARAVRQRAAMNTVNFRNRVAQEVQENQAEAQAAEAKAQELAKLEQRKIEITEEIDKLNQDTRNKFTLPVQNQLRDLKNELSQIENRLSELNSGK